MSQSRGRYDGSCFAFTSNVYWNLWSLRLPAMQRLVARGARVIVLTPPVVTEDLFSRHGIDYRPLDMQRGARGPLADIRAVRQLASTLAAERVDVLHTFNLKPNLIGAFAARRAGTPHVIATITGLGLLHSEGGGPGLGLLRRGVERLQRHAFRRASAIVFQNDDDRAHFLDRRLCRPDQARLIISSGVDTERFSRDAVTAERRAALRAEWGIGEGEAVVTMIARLLPSKGVREFVGAAAALCGRARFVLIGGPDPAHRGAIPPAELAAWQASSAVITPGFQRNVAEWLAISDVFVLPSYYREGVPRTVLEAMAMALPIVTTDMPGCRETVEPGGNGVLIRPRDMAALSRAVAALLDDAALRRRLGERSRALAIERFSADRIADQYLALYDALLVAA